MKTKSLSKKYLGENARNYESNRSFGKNWQKEQSIFEELLKKIPNESTIIDVPVGTGRFVELYKKQKMAVVGIDVSVDMLEECKKKAESKNYRMVVKEGSIFNLDYKDGSFDVAVCIRFLNWIVGEDFDRAFAELYRVTDNHLIVGIRHFVPLKELYFTSLGLNRIIRQRIQRFQKTMGRDGLIIHEKERVHKLFTQYNLKLMQSKCIECRGDGTDYYIYHLCKK